ncbi:hypothetical protein GE061_013992 [Apolygus lucorum]|uniref:non-specific serine/threonine protein kinase n=1 Tax=Apolygus lucorum TaxID=248454 RepID=A0A6A4KCQ5_APOLU|nr:hypothetical protein GE061_013992 [Apolygus lucorum]
MDFVKDWAITQTLGEGAYGEVKLVMNKHTNEYVAMKMINTREHPDASKEVKKEVGIHKCLRHPHVIQFYGSRSHGKHEYIFLEYAAHGELFDKIEPDVGMSQAEARKYMSQLLSGIDYLHSRGIAHRDIKPENLLLDLNDNLKISDFGLATMFRAGGKERALQNRCGTLPYVAPEVLLRPYAAQPADIWSCGIVLVAMLSGELPWDQASDDCADFKHWKCGSYTQLAPWTKLDNLTLSLLRKVLAPLPSARYTSAEIQNTRWFKQEFKKGDQRKIEQLAKAMKRAERAMEDDEDVTDAKETCSSQVAAAPASTHICDEAMRAFLSQPTSLDDMLVSSQLLNTQPSSAQNVMQKVVRRMTRFNVNLTVTEAVEELEATLSHLNLEWKTNFPNIFTVTTTDRRKTVLVFKASLMEVDEGTFLDFRLSKGCGLEFKRLFVTIRMMFKEMIIKN